MQLKTFTFLILLFLSGTLLAQEKLNVAGDARIEGVLKLIKGDDNTVIGLNAGPALTTGSDNTFMGEKAGLSTTIGEDNVFLGNDAGRTNVGGSSNIFVGGDAGQDNTSGSHNIYVGNASGQSGSTATDNTFVGDSTGYVNTASGNTFIGSRAGKNNTTGAGNVLIGNYAGENVNSNSRNTFIGDWAGRNTRDEGTTFDGIENTFIGFQAGISNTTGYRNTFIGDWAGLRSTTGDANTIVGKEAGYQLIEGSENTIIGDNAGQSDLRYGNKNVIIGRSAGFIVFESEGALDNNTIVGTDAILSIFETNITNSTVLGYQASTSVSNKVRIGNGSVTSIEGQVNFVGVSDKRFKKNIQDSPLGLEFIQKLRPVTYEFKEGHEGITYTGFIAQEVEEAVKEMKLEFSGVVPPAHERDHYGLRYAEFTVPLVKATQEQQELIEELETEVSDQNQKIVQLERDNRQLRDELAEIKALLNRVLEADGQSAVDQTIQLGSARLLQNSPNPFSEATYIDYFIPEGTAKAQIQITDMNGRVLKLETIAQSGEGRLQLRSQSLAAGTYAYSLLVDGRVVETKQMVLTK